MSFFNKNFGQRDKSWIQDADRHLVKIEIFIKNSNFGQKLQFWSKSLILVKNFIFGQKYIQKKLDRLGQRVFILPTPKTFSFLVINIKNVKSNFFRSNSAQEFPY